MRMWQACEQHRTNTPGRSSLFSIRLYFVVRGREIRNAFTMYASLVVGLWCGTLAVKVKRSLRRTVRVKGKIREIGPYVSFYTLRIFYYVHCLDNDFCFVYVRFSRPRSTIRIFGFIIVVVIVQASGPMYIHTFPSVGETSYRLPSTILRSNLFEKRTEQPPWRGEVDTAKQSLRTRKPNGNLTDPRMTHDDCRDGITVIKVNQTRHTYISSTKSENFRIVNSRKLCINFVINYIFVANIIGFYHFNETIF